LKSDRTAGVGSALKHPASSLSSQRKITQSATHKGAHAFALVRFGFWTQTALSNAPSRLQKQIENYEAASERKQSVVRADEKLTAFLDWIGLFVSTY
jgi:glycerol kinase